MYSHLFLELPWSAWTYLSYLNKCLVRKMTYAHYIHWGYYWYGIMGLWLWLTVTVTLTHDCSVDSDSVVLKFCQKNELNYWIDLNWVHAMSPCQCQMSTCFNCLFVLIFISDGLRLWWQNMGAVDGKANTSSVAWLSYLKKVLPFFTIVAFRAEYLEEMPRSHLPLFIFLIPKFISHVRFTLAWTGNI